MIVKKDANQRNASMYRGAPVSSFLKAKSLRENQTIAESKLWERLKAKQLKGLKFRRQHPIGLYIVDFYCHQLKLAIEIDGGYHDTVSQREKDELRTKNLEGLGLKVIRFKNSEVEKNLNKVLKTLVKITEDRLPK